MTVYSSIANEWIEMIFPCGVGDGQEWQSLFLVQDVTSVLQIYTHTHTYISLERRERERERKTKARQYERDRVIFDEGMLRAAYIR